MTDTPSKPVHVPDCSQAKLWELHREHKFDELLKKCKKLPILPRRRRKLEDTFHPELTEYEEGWKYIDETAKHSVAVIFHYTDFSGNTSTTIRSLRIGDTIYDAACRPPKP